MRTLFRKMKHYIYRFKMFKHFRNTIFHDKAFADTSSTLGENTVLFQNVKVLNSILERYTYVQSNSNIYNSDIGPFCSISSYVTIGLASHPIHMVSTSPVFYDNTQPLPKFFTNEKVFIDTLPRTIIGADVWIGQGAMIKAGITVGVGSVIGAGALVTKDVAPYSVVGGIPARVLNMRFDDTLCQKLYDSQWWKLYDNQLHKIVPHFTNPERMLNIMKED